MTAPAYLDYNATTPVDPVLFGADQEQGLRPGTENVPAIVGLGEAAAEEIGRAAEALLAAWRALALHPSY